MECGPGTEVTRRVSAIKLLSTEAESHIRIGGVVDRDFKTDAIAKKLTDDFGVFVLPVHEIENLFICPAVLQALLEQNGRGNQDALTIIKAVSDARAGSWIFQYSMALPPAKNLPGIVDAAKSVAKNLRWEQFDADRDKTIKSIVAASGYDQDAAAKFTKLVELAANKYQSRRDEATLWTVCEGKQVYAAIAASIGFSDPQALAQATFALWRRVPEIMPAELVTMREYFSGL
jgi:hypothetical protein